MSESMDGLGLEEVASPAVPSILNRNRQGGRGGGASGANGGQDFGRLFSFEDEDLDQGTLRDAQGTFGAFGAFGDAQGTFGDVTGTFNFRSETAALISKELDRGEDFEDESGIGLDGVTLEPGEGDGLLSNRRH
mmetsp:Transcript_23980/g.40221  ORF Transcript_23980/g.40221 Transcript_23980/m.40221 type:complete len:134 (-) Transcript_23980:449-850(-)